MQHEHMQLAVDRRIFRAVDNRVMVAPHGVAINTILAGRLRAAYAPVALPPFRGRNKRSVRKNAVDSKGAIYVAETDWVIFLVTRNVCAALSRLPASPCPVQCVYAQDGLVATA